MRPFWDPVTAAPRPQASKATGWMPSEVTTSARTSFPRSRAAAAIPSRSWSAPVEVSLWVTQRTEAEAASLSRKWVTSPASKEAPQGRASSTVLSP